MHILSELNKPLIAGKHHTFSTMMAGVIGNVMEWYDFALYGFFAPVLSGLFFPSDNPTASLLATYGVFAGGFMMRPLGAILFGYIGDKVSRRRALLLSVIMMAVPTLLLGLLPTHAQIGLAAGVLLTLVRLVQGASVGGEFSASVTYVVETSPRAIRGLSGSWANVGSMSGMLLGAGAAAAATSLLPEATVQAWGWRVPFLFGGLLGVIALYLRRSLSPSQLFEHHEARHASRSPLRETLTVNFRETLQAVAFIAGYGVLFYVPIVYLPTYVSRFTDLPLDQALQANTISIAFLILLIPLMGLASDFIITCKRLIVLAFVISAILSIWLLELAKSGTFSGVMASQLIFAALIAVPLGVAPATMVELYPTEDRLTGYSLAYNLGMGVVGGTTPLVATFLINASGNLLSPAFYMVGAAAISALAVITMRDRSREPLR